MPPSPRLPVACLAVALALGPAGCGGGAGAGGTGGRPSVVAAESIWGSLVTELGGDRVAVRSIIANPATDPHGHQPNAADARALAGARLVIANGIDYDPWVSRTLAADPVNGRRTLTVGDVLGLAPGDNPHQWYSPASVLRVIDALTAQLSAVDPGDAGFFAARRSALLGPGLAAYRRDLAVIRARYAGIPVGASESIAVPLTDALGLRLITPPGYLRAISEGIDPSAQDTATVHSQVDARAIRVWLLNTQNQTPDVTRLTAEARARGIPIVTLTETPDPVGASFVAWQTTQLARLGGALAQSSGR